MFWPRVSTPSPARAFALMLRFGDRVLLHSSEVGGFLRADGHFTGRCDILPSEHILESCMVAIEPDETPIVGSIATLGYQNFIVGSDYPHPPSTFPNTAAGIETMVGLTDEMRAAMLGGNLKRLFRI